MRSGRRWSASSIHRAIGPVAHIGRAHRALDQSAPSPAPARPTAAPSTAAASSSPKVMPHDDPRQEDRRCGHDDARPRRRPWRRRPGRRRPRVRPDGLVHRRRLHRRLLDLRPRGWRRRGRSPGSGTRGQLLLRRTHRRRGRHGPRRRGGGVRRRGRPPAVRRRGHGGRRGAREVGQPRRRGRRSPRARRRARGLAAEPRVPQDVVGRRLAVAGHGGGAQLGRRRPGSRGGDGGRGRRGAEHPGGRRAPGLGRRRPPPRPRGPPRGALPVTREDAAVEEATKESGARQRRTYRGHLADGQPVRENLLEVDALLAGARRQPPRGAVVRLLARAPNGAPATQHKLLRFRTTPKNTGSTLN